MAEASGRIKNIKSDEDFEKELREAGDRLVIVDFFSDDCVYSEAMTNKFFQLSERYREAVFLKVDMDSCPHTVDKYRVHSTPTYLFFKEGTELRRVRGAGGERLEGAIMSHFRSSTTEVAVPEGQMDLSFLLDSNECECLNEDDDHPFKNALRSGAEYLESDCDEQLIITLAFKYPVKLHSLQLTGPNDGRAPKTVKLFINLPPCQTPSFDDAERMQPVQEFCLTEGDVCDDAVLSLKFVRFQTVNSLTIFVKDNQGEEETTVINHIGLFGTPRDITKANLREPPSPESDEDEDLETIIGLLLLVKVTQGIIDIDVLEQKEGSENLSVIDKITPHWCKFADAIEMEPQTCEQIAAAHPDDAQACCKAMFLEWLDGKADFPPTWEVLLAKLTEIDLEEIAMQLEEILDKEAEESSTDQDNAQVGETNQDELQMGETDQDEAQVGATDQDEAQVGETDQDEAQVGETDQDEAQVVATDQDKVQMVATDQVCPNICARTMFRISGNGPHAFDWRKHGFKLQIPEDALPAGQTQCDVHITTTLPNIQQLDLPDNSIPVSAFYDISTTQKFSLPVTVEIQHCAKTSQYASLSFVISRNEMPFKYLDGGEFPTDSSYGRITITHFSKIGAIFKKVARKETSPAPTATTSAKHPAETTVEPCVRSYCSQTFRERKELLKWRVHFIITCNLEVCKTRLEAEFEKLNAECGPHQEIEFEKDMITLEIPREGIFVQDGWQLRPLTHPAITKKRVDEFLCGQWIPSCQLDVTWTRQERSPEKELFHNIHLTGAKEPFNFFTVTCPQPASGSTSPQFSPQPASGSTSPQFSHTQFQQSPETKPTLKDLVLIKVTNWYDLGLQLDIEDDSLAVIRQNNPQDTAGCKREMFRIWLKMAEPCYLKLADALVAIGEENQASQLRQKYIT